MLSPPSTSSEETARPSRRRSSLSLDAERSNLTTASLTLTLLLFQEMTVRTMETCLSLRKNYRMEETSLTPNGTLSQLVERKILTISLLTESEDAQEFIFLLAAIAIRAISASGTETTNLEDSNGLLSTSPIKDSFSPSTTTDKTRMEPAKELFFPLTTRTPSLISPPRPMEETNGTPFPLVKKKSLKMLEFLNNALELSTQTRKMEKPTSEPQEETAALDHG